MVELVIKIPEDVKNRLCFEAVIYQKDIQVICEALNNSVSLPKGHGDLKDIDKIISDGISKEGFCDWYDEMEYADTIIKADKAESEDKEREDDRT